jgi:hypothetical protein
LADHCEKKAIATMILTRLRLPALLRKDFQPILAATENRVLHQDKFPATPAQLHTSAIKF